MIRKCLSMIIICLLAIGANTIVIAAKTRTDDSLSKADKIKANVLKRGTGEKARVNVKMQNGTKIKGFISQAGNDSFTLTDSKTMQTTTVAYSDVAEVKGSGGLSTAAIVLIGVGVAVGVAAVVFASSSKGIKGPIGTF